MSDISTMDKKKLLKILNQLIDMLSLIHILKEYLREIHEDVTLDFSPESLIPLWGWYETQIVEEDKDPCELQSEKEQYPEWVRDHISDKKISMETLKYAWDIAIYFAEVLVRNNKEKISWGYITKPKRNFDVNLSLIHILL